jgi:nucleoid-associated protein YgaU
MAQFVHTVRFVLGMAMLIAGVSLVYPLVTLFWPGVGGQASVAPPAAAAPAHAAAGVVDGAAGVPPGGAHAIPDVRIGAAAGGESTAAPPPVVAAVPPPPPPAPLPPSGLDFSPAPPSLDAAYRSTVDIPPPPLLDVHAPPPLAGGWSLPEAAVRPAAVAAQPPVIEAPATYVVRDGDDLTGIAIRVYGHAGAATAIWDANRDRLADPQLLPIGMALRMPPSWTLPAVTASGGGRPGVIEPTFAGATRVEANRIPPEPDVSGATAPSGRHWLEQPPSPVAAMPAAVPVAHQPAPPAPARPAKVWVAAGDSLDSIALRFYGDRSASARILQANRDRLRSPELLVPGMELRLP